MIYRWDRFELDTTSYVLRDRGEALRIEPRVLDLLSCLVARRGTLVTKDELAREVWNDQIVGAAALSRCVYEARRALGDDAKQQKYIATVHGRGFRFVAPMTATPAPEKLGEVVPTESVEHAGPTPGGGAGAPPGVVPRSRRRWAIGLILGSVLGLGMALVGGKTGDPWRVAMASTGPTRIGILAIATAEVEAQPLVAQALAEYLAGQLEQSPLLQVVGPGRVGELVAENTTLDAAMRFGDLDLLLEAKLFSAVVPDRARVDVDLYWVVSEHIETAPLGRFEVAVPDTNARLRQFNRQRERIADAVAEGLNLRALPRLSGGRHASEVEAFRLTSEVERELSGKSCSPVALRLAQRATRLDPSYADAWAMQAHALSNAVWACGADESLFEEAYQSAEQALELAPEWAPKLRMFQVDLLLESGRPEEAWDVVLEAEREGSDLFLASSGAYVLRWMGFLEEAVARMEADLAVNPHLFLDWGGIAPLPLLYQGRLEAFLDRLPATDWAYHRFYRGWALFLAGRTSEAFQALKVRPGDDPEDLFARLAHSLSAVLEGDLTTARTRIADLERLREERGHIDGEMAYKQAQLFALAGDRDGALRNVERTVANGFVCSPCLREDPALRLLMAEPDFADILARADARRAAFVARFGPPT